MDITKMKVAGWECRYYGMEHTELERRRDLVREVMDEKAVHVLLAVDMVRGGYFQWLLGAGLSERPTEEILIFPRNGQMTICLTSGCFTDEQQKSYQKVDAVNSQDARFGDAVNVPALYYRYLTEHLGDSRRVGILYPDSLRKNVKDYLEERIPGLEWEDLTEELEKRKAVKSPAEQTILQDMADFHDRLFWTMGCLAIPGRLEGDVVKELRWRAYQMGCGGEDVTRNAVVHFNSAPDRCPAEAAEIFYPGRRIQEGDRISLKVHCVGRDDFYGVLGRCFVLGQACEQTKKDWEALIKVQDYAASLLRPGSTLKEAAEKVNVFREELGLSKDTGNFLYGMGHMAGEAPHLACGADMPLQEGMVLAVAPQLKRKREEPLYCADMYLVSEEETKRLNRFPRTVQEIFIQ